MAHKTISSDRARWRKVLAVVVMLALGGGAIGYAYAQSGISLNAPVSFPVDI